MPHEFLLHTDRNTDRIQPRSMCVPERVRIDVACPSFPGSIASISRDLKHELDFMKFFDAAMKSVMDIVDMPN